MIHPSLRPELRLSFRLRASVAHPLLSAEQDGDPGAILPPGRNDPCYVWLRSGNRHHHFIRGLHYETYTNEVPGRRNVDAALRAPCRVEPPCATAHRAAGGQCHHRANFESPRIGDRESRPDLRDG